VSLTTIATAGPEASGSALGVPVPSRTICVVGLAGALLNIPALGGAAIPEERTIGLAMAMIRGNIRLSVSALFIDRAPFT
jgi:hypothetical protein